MELSEITYNDTVKRLLISQYQKPNFLSLFNILSNIMEDIQTSNFELRDKFWLADSTGDQLTLIAKLWNVIRNGRDDDTLRAEVYAVINDSMSGTVPELQNVLLNVYGGTYADYLPVYPGCYFFESDADITQTELERISPAGVGVMIYDPNQEEETTLFTYNRTIGGGRRSWILLNSYQFMLRTEIGLKYIELNVEADLYLRYNSGKMITYTEE